jgi:hypothetical protein
MSKPADDDDDFLAIDDDEPHRLNTPEAIAKRAATRSKDMTVPEKVETDGAMDSWPYYLPTRGDRGGRPRIIETAEEFDRLTDEYFVQCWERHQRPTMTGLQLHLGFASSVSFFDYAKRAEFSNSVTRARNLVKSAYETNLIRHQGSVQGVMFALRNFGRVEGDWVDVNRTELTGENGQPIQTMNANLNANMSDIEKATRLFHMMRNTIALQHKAKEDDDDDPLAI